MTSFSYQLYSSRNFPPLADTLSMLGKLGYAQVEGYGGLMADPAAVAELAQHMKANGLSMPTMHVGLDMVEDTPDAVIEIANQLGVKAAFVPHLDADSRPTDADGWLAFGARRDKAGAPLRAAGLAVGWHNHDFEYASGLEAYPIDYILEGGPDLAFEFDVAWCVRAGADPFPTIDRYGDRLMAAHVKDIAPMGECEDEDGWADVGQGTMDWPAIMTALKNVGCTYFVMEHDNPSDDARFASRSLDFVNTL